MRTGAYHYLVGLQLELRKDRIIAHQVDEPRAVQGRDAVGRKVHMTDTRVRSADKILRILCNCVPVSTQDLANGTTRCILHVRIRHRKGPNISATVVPQPALHLRDW